MNRRTSLAAMEGLGGAFSLTPLRRASAQGTGSIPDPGIATFLRPLYLSPN